MTNKSLGVMTHLMQISNVKIFNKLTSLKVSFVKTGIFLSLAAYWGVIIVGTFITFNEVVFKQFIFLNGCIFTHRSSFC